MHRIIAVYKRKSQGFSVPNHTPFCEVRRISIMRNSPYAFLYIIPKFTPVCFGVLCIFTVSVYCAQFKPPFVLVFDNIPGCTKFLQPAGG